MVSMTYLAGKDRERERKKISGGVGERSPVWREIVIIRVGNNDWEVQNDRFDGGERKR